MFTASRVRWERARHAMIDRWVGILASIDDRDRGVVLAMANVLDEFCEEASVERQVATGRREDPALPILKFPVGSAMAGRCVFCRGVAEYGGCFGMLREFNQAVLDGGWPRAREIAREFLDRLRVMDLGGPIGPALQ